MAKYLVRPIKNKIEYQLSLKKLDSVWGAKKNTEDGDLLEMLLLVITNYERKTIPFPKLDPVEAIKYKMEEEGLKQSDLVKYFGIKSRVSEVLNYKKPMTLKMIKNLYNEFGIPAETLLAS